MTTPKHDDAPPPKTFGSPHKDAAPKEGPPEETVAVLLTGDNRELYEDEQVPKSQIAFRIHVRGQHFEQVGEQDGKRVYAPTR